MGNEAFLLTALEEAKVARLRGAPIIPEAAAAHAAVESAYGRSGLAARARNLFGIKARGIHTPFWSGDSVTMPTWEVIDGERVQTEAAFRAYGSWAACFGDYGNIISRAYPIAAAAECAPAFAAGLFIAGPLKWATDPLAYDKTMRVLGENASILCGPTADGGEEDALRMAEVLVLDDFLWGDRVSILLGRFPVALRGAFAYRVRGGKLDVRRA